MSKRSGVVTLLVFAGLLIVAGVVGNFIISTNRLKSDKTDTSNGDGSSETVDTLENISQFTPNTLQMRKGTFKKIENRKIFIDDRSFTIEYPLNNEIVVVCTQEDLESITENNYGDARTIVRSGDGLREIITVGEFVVAFTQKIGSTSTVHTLYISSDSCPK
jgi:hypothetical protein